MQHFGESYKCVANFLFIFHLCMLIQLLPLMEVSQVTHVMCTRTITKFTSVRLLFYPISVSINTSRTFFPSWHKTPEPCRLHLRTKWIPPSKGSSREKLKSKSYKYVCLCLKNMDIPNSSLKELCFIYVKK